MKEGLLYLCPTPLGNLEDVTLRVLRILREADIIAAEDTRHTRKLLSRYDIHTPLVSYHEHNKTKKTDTILEWLQNGKTVALVSDAGTPAIADPGEELVRAAISHDISVISLPGPVAAVTALCASGLPVAPFVFYGFLPQRGKEKKEALARILAEDKTVVFYEAPHRLVKTLAALLADDEERQIVVARELTKIHEEYHRGSIKELHEAFTRTEPRGECTVILGARRTILDADRDDPLELAEKFLASGYSTRQAAREVAGLTGFSRNEIYRRIIEKE